MEIRYSTRSVFLEPCEAAIRANKAKLDVGETVNVELGERGYPGYIVVTIRNDNRNSFGTDWSRSDPTRFPARIKAAAKALLNCGCEGVFEVSHDGGSLTIRRR